MPSPSQTDRTAERMVLASVCFSAWFAALLFGVLVPAAHGFLALALFLWPWRATFAAARIDDDGDGERAPLERDRS